jgi:hypothetical protein
LLTAPEKLPDFSLVGVLSALCQALVGKPAIAIKLLEQDGMAVLMDILRSVSPETLVTTAGVSRGGHGVTFWVVKELVESAQAGGIDMTAQLVSCGYIDLVVSSLSAVQRSGADNANGVIIVNGVLWLLRVLDGEALGEIEDKLRMIPSAFRYLKDAKIFQVQDFGLSCGPFASAIAVNLYGKDEENSFGFTREYTPIQVRPSCVHISHATWPHLLLQRPLTCCIQTVLSCHQRRMLTHSRYSTKKLWSAKNSEDSGRWLQTWAVGCLDSAFQTQQSICS